MKPSYTYSPFILDFFPCFWHKNTLKLFYVFTSVLFPNFHCPWFLYWIAWTFFQVWHIWEKLASSISLILSYLWVSVAMLRRNNVILFATRVVLVEICVARLFHLFKSEFALNLSSVVIHYTFFIVSNFICNSCSVSRNMKATAVIVLIAIRLVK